MSLSAGELEVLADRVAALVVERLAPAFAPAPVSARPGMVDAAGLADALGVTRAFVYEHARELGAVRLGDGPRARLRFDPVVARAALQEPQESQEPEADPQVPRPVRRRPVGRPAPGSVLQVRRAA